MKLKVWVWPLLLSTLLTAGNMGYWFLFGEGKPTLTVWLNMAALVLCGIGFTQGFKLGFRKKN